MKSLIQRILEADLTQPLPEDLTSEIPEDLISLTGQDLIPRGNSYLLKKEYLLAGQCYALATRSKPADAYAKLAILYERWDDDDKTEETLRVRQAYQIRYKRIAKSAVKSVKEKASSSPVPDPAAIESGDAPGSTRLALFNSTRDRILTSEEQRERAVTDYVEAQVKAVKDSPVRYAEVVAQVTVFRSNYGHSLSGPDFDQAVEMDIRSTAVKSAEADQGIKNAEKLKHALRVLDLTEAQCEHEVLVVERHRQVVALVGTIESVRSELKGKDKVAFMRSKAERAEQMPELKRHIAEAKEIILARYKSTHQYHASIKTAMELLMEVKQYLNPIQRVLDAFGETAFDSQVYKYFANWIIYNRTGTHHTKDDDEQRKQNVYQLVENILPMLKRVKAYMIAQGSMLALGEAADIGSSRRYKAAEGANDYLVELLEELDDIEELISKLIGDAADDAEADYQSLKVKLNTAYKNWQGYLLRCDDDPSLFAVLGNASDSEEPDGESGISEVEAELVYGWLHELHQVMPLTEEEVLSELRTVQARFSSYMEAHQHVVDAAKEYKGVKTDDYTTYEAAHETFEAKQGQVDWFFFQIEWLRLSESFQKLSKEIEFIAEKVFKASAPEHELCDRLETLKFRLEEVTQEQNTFFTKLADDFSLVRRDPIIDEWEVASFVADWADKSVITGWLKQFNDDQKQKIVLEKKLNQAINLDKMRLELEYIVDAKAQAQAKLTQVLNLEKDVELEVSTSSDFTGLRDALVRDDVLEQTSSRKYKVKRGFGKLSALNDVMKIIDETADIIGLAQRIQAELDYITSLEILPAKVKATLEVDFDVLKKVQEVTINQLKSELRDLSSRRSQANALIAELSHNPNAAKVVAILKKQAGLKSNFDRFRAKLIKIFDSLTDWIEQYTTLQATITSWSQLFSDSLNTPFSGRAALTQKNGELVARQNDDKASSRRLLRELADAGLLMRDGSSYSIAEQSMPWLQDIILIQKAWSKICRDKAPKIAMIHELAEQHENVAGLATRVEALEAGVSALTISDTLLSYQHLSDIKSNLEDLKSNIARRYENYTSLFDYLVSIQQITKLGDSYRSDAESDSILQTLIADYELVKVAKNRINAIAEKLTSSEAVRHSQTRLSSMIRESVTGYQAKRRKSTANTEAVSGLLSQGFFKSEADMADPSAGAPVDLYPQMVAYLIEFRNQALQRHFPKEGSFFMGLYTGGWICSRLVKIIDESLKATGLEPVAWKELSV